MDERELAGVVQLLQRAGVGVQAEAALCRIAGILRVDIDRAVDFDIGALGDIDRVVVRRDQAQPIAAATQKDRDQNIIVARRRPDLVGVGEHQVAHAPTRHRSNRGTASHDELSS
jgi:hypothetical protein